MKAISTKYLPATDTRGSRIKATDGDGNSITIGYPHEYNQGSDVHAQAALALCRKMGWDQGDGLISGGTKDGWVFVFTNSDKYSFRRDEVTA